jgi:hypothetical protein
MSTAAIVDNVLASVRALLRQHAPYTRHALDLLLGDLEADLRRNIDDLIAEEVASALREAEADREYEVLAAERAKSKRKQKKITTEQPETTP